MLEKPFIFKVNENGGGPHLLLQVFSERGWIEYKEDGCLKDKWNLWWKTSCLPMPHYRSLKSWQFINRIPDAATICRKDYLARCLKTMKSLFGSIYDFSPTTFILPIDYTKLVTRCTHVQTSEERVWICKPVGRSQGRGITVFRKATELVYDSMSSVVQEYIKNPLLIGGYKFDLRLYVCVPCFHPLTVYVYKEGLARFGTNKFSLSELDNKCAHLTNSSINKHSPGYTEFKEKVGAGCKWSLKQLRLYFLHNGYDDWLLWQKIANIIVLTVASQIAGVPTTTNCFEFYGFDILIDSDLKPWLIEVNNSPALCTDCDLDPAIKKPMLHDLLDLLGMPMCNTGLSLVADWGDPFTAADNDQATEQTFTNTARTAVTIIKLANRWKKQIQPDKNQKMCSREHRCLKSLDKYSVSPSKGSKNHELKKTQNKMRKKFEKPDYKWDNGLDWEKAPTGGGDWVRIYPMGERDGTVNEARDVVTAVSKTARAARAVFNKYTANQDEPRDLAMMHDYTLVQSLWHPSR